MTANADVLVLGGGPAGATASLLLATWGHSVRMVTKPAGEKRLAVSLPPSAGKLLDVIGVRGAIDQAGFVRSTGNTVWWGGPDARIERFAAGAYGWQVEVERFAAVLLECAIAAGVRIEQRAAFADEHASFVLDCSGRSGLIAREKSVRKYRDGPRTVALIGEWRRAAPWPVPDDTHTLIESYDGGWMWSVPVGSGVRHIAAMVDPQRSDLSRGGSSSGVYLAEVAKTREFKRLVGDATLVRDPRGYDASQYYATNYAGDGWLLVGDAGSFIDPLSSAGVKKALASGWLADVVAHTSLTSPSMRGHALELYDAREREIEEELFRQSRSFLAAAATRHRHAFWDERADEGESESSGGEAVRQVFERLKSRDAWRPQVSPAIAIESRPCIRGNEIVLEPHIVTSGEPRGVRYLRSIDMVAVLELAPSTQQVPDLYDEYVKRIGSIPLPEFLFAVATAVAKGWLVAE